MSKLTEEAGMAHLTKLLVVANQTVDSDDLHDALLLRAKAAPIKVTIVVPQDTNSGLGQRLRVALGRLRQAGIDAEGMLGDTDPCVAAIEVWDPRRYDEIIVSTLPTGTSRWLQIDVPHRIARKTDATVSHLVCRATRHAPDPIPA